MPLGGWGEGKESARGMTFVTFFFGTLVGASADSKEGGYSNVFTLLLLPLIPKYSSCHPYHLAPKNHLSKLCMSQLQGHSRGVGKETHLSLVYKTSNSHLN